MNITITLKAKGGDGLSLSSKQDGSSLAQINCDQKNNNCASLNNGSKAGDREYYTVPDYAYLPVDDKWATVYGLEVTQQGELKLLIANGKKDISTLSQIDPPGYKKPNSFSKITTTNPLLQDTNKKYYFSFYKKTAAESCNVSCVY